MKGQIALMLLASWLFMKLPYQQPCLARHELHLQDVGLSKVVQHGEVSHTLRCASQLLRPPTSACLPYQCTGVLYDTAGGNFHTLRCAPSSSLGCLHALFLQMPSQVVRHGGVWYTTWRCKVWCISRVPSYLRP